MDQPKLFKLDAGFLKEWIEALRGNHYQQGQNQLMSDDGKQYCCLGVACDLAGIEVSEYYGAGLPIDIKNYSRKEPHFEDLPEELRTDKEGLSNLAFVVSQLNDGFVKLEVDKLIAKGAVFPSLKFYAEGRLIYNFEQIADFLEANVEPVEDENSIFGEKINPEVEELKQKIEEHKQYAAKLHNLIESITNEKNHYENKADKLTNSLSKLSHDMTLIEFLCDDADFFNRKHTIKEIKKIVK